MSSRCQAGILFVVVALVFFLPLLLRPAALLYSDYSDFIGYHLPCKAFLTRSYQETGALPWWCPLMFAGMPFAHDPQVAMFYPPHWPALLVPEQHVGAVLSWLLVLHVLLAGISMYAYARHRGLDGAGALVAGLGYMFAGKWLLHLLVAGHFNAAPLAWLPLGLLFLEQAMTRPQRARAIWAGAVFALIVLGSHPQLTFYTALFVVMWTVTTPIATSPYQVLDPTSLTPEFEVTPKRRAMIMVIALGLAGVTTLLLAAIQILPAYEAATASSRNLGVPSYRDTIMGGTLSILGFVGPPIYEVPGWLWEDRGGVGLVWLVAAVCAPVLLPSRLVRAEATITGVWLFLGLGGVVLLQWVPGFHLWRLPSRMLLLAGFPIALLAGRSVQALCAEIPPGDEILARCRGLLGKVAAILFVILLVVVVGFRKYGFPLHLVPYWPAAVMLLLLCFWLLRGPRSAWAWVVLLLADAWLLAWPYVEVRSEAEVRTPSSSVRYLQLRRGERGRALDVPPTGRLDCSTPLWLDFALLADVEAVRGYNPLDVLRFKEYLNLMMDRDEPLRAVNGLTLPVPASIVIKNQALADLLGVRFLLIPRGAKLEEHVPATALRDGAWQKVFEDPAPRGYCIARSGPASDDGGFHELPVYEVYENRQTLPRVFLVGQAKPLPGRDGLLATMKATDFRGTVLLEGEIEESKPGSDFAGTARIVTSSPNEVVVEASASAPGWLVLTDVWFPGWSCTLDGIDLPVRRANYLFRAVRLPAGEHRLEFRFSPRSLELGAWLSALGLLLVLLSIGWAVVRR
ncbi:MAG: hypothetical protein AB7K24_10540 [Gemmataceae bacterium]